MYDTQPTRSHAPILTAPLTRWREHREAIERQERMERLAIRFGPIVQASIGLLLAAIVAAKLAK